MTAPTANSMPAPVAFLRAGWTLVRTDPWILAARILSDLANLALRAATAFMLGLFVVMHFGNHVKAGGSLLGWPAAAAEHFTRPAVLAAMLGFAFAGWAVTFTIRCAFDAGIWGVLGSAARGQSVARVRSLFVQMTREFPRAVGIRALTTCTDFVLVSVIVGTVVASAELAAHAGVALGSPRVVPALIIAASGVAICTFAVLMRLTAAFVAAPAFVERGELGEALLLAAQAVIRNPVYVYRLFIMAAAVLIPPLFAYWLIALAQNLAYEVPALAPVLLVVRLAGEALLIAGIAAFVVMLHATFFAYYAWRRGYLAMTTEKGQRERLRARPGTPSLDELVPKEYPHVVPVDELMAEWPHEALLEPQSPKSEDEPFDLGAILDSERKTGDDD